ncbi:MAG: hypothetical protein GX495_21170, partial [Chloroflexi bacterium]|nr:hypothetical protein [Chloroflexota bacterium]
MTREMDLLSRKYTDRPDKEPKHHKGKRPPGDGCTIIFNVDSKATNHIYNSSLLYTYP